MSLEDSICSVAKSGLGTVNARAFPTVKKRIKKEDYSDAASVSDMWRRLGPTSVQHSKSRLFLFPFLIIRPLVKFSEING